jgi:integrase
MTTPDVPDPQAPLPDSHNLPSGFTRRRRVLRDGSVRVALLLRLEEAICPRGKNGKPKRLSWRGPNTYGGLADLVAKQRRMTDHLKAAKREADLRGSPLFAPTVAEACKDYLDDPDTRAMRSYVDRKRHMKLLSRCMGGMLMSTVSHIELRAVIAAELARGQSYQSLRRTKAAIARFFRWAFENDRIPSVEFVKRVTVPTSAKVDRRERELLADAEFWTLVECATVPLRYRAMYIASRMVGGMRASDLHALDWGMVDTAEWAWCDVVRPKTDGRDDVATRQSLPPEASAILKEWFLASGCPGRDKPVFGRQRPGKNGRGGKGARMNYSGPSYARRLRKHLLLAGVTRHELHHNMPAGPSGRGGSKRADFHSFRRLYNTGLARAGVNVQQAMALAGHRSATTHMRYVKLAKVIMSAPAGAMPQRAKK